MKKNFNIIQQGEKFSNNITHDKDFPVVEFPKKRIALKFIMERLFPMDEKELENITKYVKKKGIKY